VFLKLTPRHSVGKNKQRKKLQPCYIGLFPIVQMIGKVAYRLELPSELQGIHDVFCVSQLRQYIADPSHVVNNENIKLTANLNLDERLVQILEFQEQELRQRKIPLVKVLWNHSPVQDATWETESRMR
jgi:hypothetical protein